MASTKLATASGWIPTSQKGAADGVATLNGSSVVPGIQLPVRATGQCLSVITLDDTEEFIYLHTAARVYAVQGLVSARSADGTLNAEWAVRGAAKMDGLGVMTVLGATLVDPLGSDAGASDWNVELKTAGGGTYFVIAVTGAEGTEIHWATTVHEAAAHASIDWAVFDGVG